MFLCFSRATSQRASPRRCPGAQIHGRTFAWRPDGWTNPLQVGGDFPGQRRRVEADRPEWAIGRNAVSDREHSVADVRGKAAARVAVLVEDAKMSDQTVEIRAEPGGGDDHLRRYGRAVGEDHAVGFDRLDGADDLDAPDPHGVDELVGQRRDTTSLLHRRLQPERWPLEAVGRQVTPHQAVHARDQRIDHACGNPREQLEEDIRWKRSHGPPHEVRRCAHRKPDPSRAVVSELNSDVGGRIARANDEDVAATVGPSVGEVPGVNDLAVEATESGPRRDGRCAVVARGEDDCRGSDFTRRRVELPDSPGTVDAVDFTSEHERDVLPLNVVIEIADHVLLGRPTAGVQRNPLSGKVRQEPGRVEAEVVIARAPRNRRGRRAVENERFDAMLMIEFACDGQTSGPRADHNGVGAVLDLCSHRSPVVFFGGEDLGSPSTN